MRDTIDIILLTFYSTGELMEQDKCLSWNTDTNLAAKMLIWRILRAKKPSYKN